MLISLPCLQQTPLTCPLEAHTSQPDVLKDLPSPSITSLTFLSNPQSAFRLHSSPASVLAEVTRHLLFHNQTVYTCMFSFEDTYCLLSHILPFLLDLLQPVKPLL